MSTIPEDAEFIRERIVSRGEKVAKWREEMRVIQNRITQYENMIQRDRDYLNGSTNEEI